MESLLIAGKCTERTVGDITTGSRIFLIRAAAGFLQVPVIFRSSLLCGWGFVPYRSTTLLLNLSSSRHLLSHLLIA